MREEDQGQSVSAHTRSLSHLLFSQQALPMTLAGMSRCSVCFCYELNMRKDQNTEQNYKWEAHRAPIHTRTYGFPAKLAFDEAD